MESIIAESSISADGFYLSASSIDGQLALQQQSIDTRLSLQVFTDASAKYDKIDIKGQI
jgi:hypothetical protein